MSRKYFLICCRAFEVFTNESQSRLGVCCFDVKISTLSPFCNTCFIETVLLFTFPAEQLLPMFECISYAKSKTVDCARNLRKSPFGVNTKISSVYNSIREFLSSSSSVLESLSSICLTLASQFNSSSARAPSLYFQCAACPFSAISSMRFVRICTSTHLFSGPKTVV